MTMPKVKGMLRMNDQTMLLGTTRPASSTSSAMWATESEPVECQYILGHQSISPTQDAEHGAELPNKRSPRNTGPSCTVVCERQEDLRRGRLRREHQYDDDDREEGEEVTGHKDTFSKREMLDADDVEDANSNDRGKDQQRSLPPGRRVRIIVDGDKRLNDGADKVAIKSDDALPGDCREPTYSCQYTDEGSILRTYPTGS